MVAVKQKKEEKVNRSCHAKILISPSEFYFFNRLNSGSNCNPLTNKGHECQETIPPKIDSMQTLAVHLERKDYSWTLFPSPVYHTRHAKRLRHKITSASAKFMIFLRPGYAWVIIDIEVKYRYSNLPLSSKWCSLFTTEIVTRYVDKTVCSLRRGKRTSKKANLDLNDLR